MQDGKDNDRKCYTQSSAPCVGAQKMARSQKALPGDWKGRKFSRLENVEKLLFARLALALLISFHLSMHITLVASLT